jgi:hypothetical protein
MGRPTVILASIGDERKIIEEERQNWLHKVLMAFGADKSIINKGNMESKQHLAEIGLVVWKSVDGDINIYRPEYSTFEFTDDDDSIKEASIESKQKLVAQWHPPKIVRIKDGKKVYYRITLDEWALPFQIGEK